MFNASMTFDLGEDVNALRDMVHRWAQDRVKPMAQDIDQKNEFPPELWTEMGELGLLGITVPEDFGGAGMSFHSLQAGNSGRCFCNGHHTFTGRALPCHDFHIFVD